MAQPSQLLRDAWQEKIHQYSAKQLVVIDESLFKLRSGRRAFAYAPIGEPARYHDDMRRGDTQSIFPAYTVDGYLPCTGKTFLFNALPAVLTSYRN